MLLSALAARNRSEIWRYNSCSHSALFDSISSCYWPPHRTTTFDELGLVQPFFFFFISFFFICLFLSSATLPSFHAWWWLFHHSLSVVGWLANVGRSFSQYRQCTDTLSWYSLLASRKFGGQCPIDCLTTYIGWGALSPNTDASLLSQYHYHSTH